MIETFKKNNFDLIRLFAALQVALKHTYYHLDIHPQHPLLMGFIELFPGVPIFFFVSGFLISKSYENNFKLTDYAQNRILRLFPALFLCTLLSILSVYVSGYFSGVKVPVGEFFFWLFSQIGFLQFYNPEFMRGFGTGVLNGSLWTISVELQFYILVPILYIAMRRVDVRFQNTILLTLVLVFMSIHLFYHQYSDGLNNYLGYKLIGVSFLPWVYMFFIGVFFQKNFALFHRYLHGKATVLIVVYVIVSWVATNRYGLKLGNVSNPFIYFFLVFVVFSAAYSHVGLSDRLLNRNDISYGVYIYHIPIVNLFIYFGLVSKSIYFFVVIALVIAIASISWFLLEKKSLLLKKHPFNPFNTVRQS